MKELLLSNGWQCKQRTATLPVANDFALRDAEWFPAQVPGNVHLDLLAAGRIPDPFFGLQEQAVQWVSESDWLYRCQFELPADFLHADIVTLCCDGLDTFATAWLNGTQILTSDTMFVPQRIDVKAFLQAGHNELQILFEAALREGRIREEKLGKLALWNGDSSRLYVRKAQYHYGWDWGPTLLTAGPWRPVRLEAYTARIAELHCPVEVAADLQSATIPVHVTLEAPATLNDLTLHLALFGPAGKVLAEVTLPVSDQQIAYQFDVPAPQLWWPRGYGEQSFYRVQATLQQQQSVLDQHALRLGLRRLRLVQEAFIDEPGKSFFFEVNNTPIFCGGANWIPADSFTPRITPERYRAWLQLAADANMAMIRVWGGGIYEDESFYASCDDLGLLVWQDFMFACGLYPAANWFQQSVRAEAEATVRRLRHHPSIVIWAGNNEDYLLAGRSYDASFDGDFSTTAFPARTIYERLLPEICAQLDPQRPYWPGSPYGGANPNSREQGDCHIWDVWHGQFAPYQDYYKFAGRFVSEFGMQAFPDMATIAEFAAPDERSPQSRTIDHHNKAEGGPRRLASYVLENVPMTTDLAQYVYTTQFIQSEALGYAIRGWRRRWRGAGREYTAGALVWQLNDCWPVTSWAVVDYALRPKSAYYTLKRELAPLAIGLMRQGAEQVEIWAVNGLLTPIKAELELRIWGLDGKLISEERRPITLTPNAASELGQLASHYDETQVVGARLIQNGMVLARATCWPEPFKYLRLPHPAIKVERVDANTLRLSAERPAKGVWLSASSRVLWSDNMLDMLPGDEQTVIAQGLGDAAINITWLTQSGRP